MIIQNNYTIEHHGKLEARTKLILSQNNIYYADVRGFNTSTFNPFTGKFDAFTTLDKRLVVFDLNTVSEKYNRAAVDFVDTFASFKDADGNVYVLQRDLWAAFKMLCLDTVEEKRVDKNTGKEYTVKVHRFNKERYDEKFKSWYPKQLEYIKYFIKCNNLGVDLNGLILGNK